MASPLNTTTATLHNIPAAPEDSLYGLVAAYDADPSPLKVDLGVGAYRDSEGNPWILPSVRKAERMLAGDPDRNHEYIPINGLESFNSAARRLLFGVYSLPVREHRVFSAQALSGTGALHTGAVLLARSATLSSSILPHVYIPSPTWPIHRGVFLSAGFPNDRIHDYPYTESESEGQEGGGGVGGEILHLDPILQVLSSAPRGSIVVLQACGHNPTGADPSRNQWLRLAATMKAGGLVPFVDCAYQGLAATSTVPEDEDEEVNPLAEDAWPIRMLAGEEMGMDVLVAQSFAKNMGLYGERVGAFHYAFARRGGRGAAPSGRDGVGGDNYEDDENDLLGRIASQVAVIQRSGFSSPPAYGARLAAMVLDNEELAREWEGDLRTMNRRMVGMRRRLREELENLATPAAWRKDKSWSHVTGQKGMFCFTGLRAHHVLELRKHHVYMAETGRISIAGLNEGNVDYVARAIDEVVRSLG